jgi:hypothetical protein
MEDNAARIGNIAAVGDPGKPAIKSDNSPFIEGFDFTDVYDERKLKAFLSSAEKLIRTSREYSTYISDLRSQVIDLNHDNILINITSEDAEMEFHHYPYTLYDICSIVLNKRLLKGEPTSTFDVAREVMGLHYRNEIGIVPLTQTTHELAHSGKLFLKKSQIFGDYAKFGRDYADAIPAELKDKVLKMEQLSDKGVPSDFGGIL